MKLLSTTTLAVVVIVGMIVGVLLSVTVPAKSQGAVPPTAAPEATLTKTMCQQYPHLPKAQRITHWLHTIHENLMSADGLTDQHIMCALDLERLNVLDTGIAAACVDRPQRDFDDLTFTFMQKHLRPCGIELIRGE